MSITVDVRSIGLNGLTTEVLEINELRSLHQIGDSRARNN